jgi:aminoglycoside phosphotransferase (APT) family kinase protein
MLFALTTSLAVPDIPTLQAVLDPCELGQHLNAIQSPQWGVLHDIQIKVLKHHHGSRCTVDITLQTTTGKHELIGKVYAEDRSDVYRAMKQISKSGFGPEAEFSIPQPFAYLPELNLLIQEKVQGPLATEIFLTGIERERIRAAERCGRWLAHFHNRAPMLGQPFNFSHDLGEYWVQRIVERAGAHAGQLTEKATLLLKRLELAAAALDRSEICACHGTYSHYQIILNETGTVTLDWDSFCVTHPSLDVARFVIVLQQLALKSFNSLQALDAAIEVFCKSYTTRSKFEVAKHLPFYKAAHCLKHAKSYLKRGSGTEKTGAMLDEGLRLLAEEM